MNDKVRFGVNYIPSKNWLYSWMDWDSSAILDDFQAIASLGMDHIRAHLLWPVFQPNINYVSQIALDRLNELLDLADSCNLDVEVTVLTGWICGFRNFPAWKGNQNMFTDRDIIEAEKLLFNRIAQRIGKHPRFLGFDLGNELSVLNINENRCTTEEGDRWLNEIMSSCEEAAPNKLHVNGVDHVPWFKDWAFSRTALSNVGAATAVHTWIYFTGATDLYKPMDIGCIHLPEYFIELSKAYSKEINHPIWLQEFGASSEWMPLEKIADFTEHTIRNAATCENLWGFTWWCSHDIDTKFKGFDILEYNMGLFDINNNCKPAGKRIAELIKEFKQTPPPIIKRDTALVLPDNLLSEINASMQWNWSFAKPFMDLIKEGVRPAIVLESRAEDMKYLALRGIKELRRI